MDSQRDEDQAYDFTRNDPFDRTRPIQYVVDDRIASGDYMREIRETRVAPDAVAVWFFGQNGFLLKEADGPLIGIDLYLTNSCAEDAPDLAYRLDRQLPVFVEPEDLDIDYFVTTHSHQDHADAATIRRLRRDGKMTFVGPYDSCRIYEDCGVPKESIRLIHPGETLSLGPTSGTATFALPTDHTDLNHTGLLLRFSNGITFYNTGDTAWAERLPALLPTGVDICAVCINGGYHNLAPEQAAAIAKAVAPKVIVPCHYDMMVNNVGSPAMFRAALERAGVPSAFRMLRYYEPWFYSPQEAQ